MSKCDHCRHAFPSRMINPFIASNRHGMLRTRQLCPICALAARNKLHGFALDKPFDGPKAAGLHAQAVEYLKDRQEVARG